MDTEVGILALKLCPMVPQPRHRASNFLVGQLLGFRRILARRFHRHITLDRRCIWHIEWILIMDKFLCHMLRILAVQWRRYYWKSSHLRRYSRLTWGINTLQSLVHRILHNWTWSLLNLHRYRDSFLCLDNNMPRVLAVWVFLVCHLSHLLLVLPKLGLKSDRWVPPQIL